MKRLIFGLFLLLTMQSSAQNQEPDVEVVVSRTHSLFYMIECLLDVPHRNPDMASNFRGRIGNWGPVSKRLDEWQEHLNAANDSRLKFPPVDGRVPSLGEVLENAALDSADISEFAARASVWLKPQAAQSFTQLLERVDPLYEQYWWSGSRMEKRREELESDLEKGNFELAFDRAKKFYGGRLPGTGKPRIALVQQLEGILAVPTPTMGHNSGSLQVLEVLAHKPNPARAGVCFHEFTHGLWLGQNAKERTRWEQSFHAHGLQGRLAYAQLNEGLATAIGNGWFHRQVTGRLNSGPWYADPLIDRYGKELLPVIERALDEARPPSISELEDMVQAFERAVPKASSNFDTVAAHFGVVSSLPQAHQTSFVNKIFKLGPVRRFATKAWDESSEGQPTFQVYWLSRDELPQLQSRGWSHHQISDLNSYALRLTPKGWDLVFMGTESELLALLKKLQERTLISHKD